jgi:SAM-dependent methyltransferase
MEDPSPQPVAVKASFDARAEAIDADAWRHEFAAQLVRLVPLHPSARVLDAATGTGLAARAAARAVGTAGLVVGIDISDGMIDVARRRHGVDSAPVEFRVGDVTRLNEAEDGSFDAVICSASMIYLPARTALTEWRRLLRSGGMVGFSSFRTGFPRPAAIFRDCVREVLGIDLRDPAEVVGDPARCRQLLRTTGFTDVSVHAGEIRFSPSDVERSFEINIGSPLHEIGPLDEQSFARLRLTYEERIGQLLETEPDLATGVSVLYATAIAS